jgi:putative heme-binding domain-containing protein
MSSFLRLNIFALAALLCLHASAADRQRPPVNRDVGENKATPPERIRAAKDFKVELLYSIPGAEQGSWVNLCTDPKGRIIASDQYGGLYRFTPPAAGEMLDASKIEKLPAEIRAANGLLWFNNALWVAVNDYERKIDSGLYRITSSKGDDTLDKVEKLRTLKASGDHGVHAIVPAPDGKSLFLITGDSTIPSYDHSLVPTIWGEDHLLPRMPDGRGFMRDVLAPGGIIYRVSPDGKDFTVYSSGYRNIFDGAFNRDGELFNYDADMEYDFNTSWYRPTRIAHATSGSEYGWRNGAGKRPQFYPDNLPPVLNIGPGSPTGVTFGYGAKFPAKYQDALYALDWSWGKLYAVHLKPQGSSYTATKEEFVAGIPLPLTDAIIHPADGAMYFTIGGRKVQSGLYRVTYTGKESTAPIKLTEESAGRKERELRHRLETFHTGPNPAAVKEAWPHLNSDDRFIRWAARTAIEHQPVSTWSERALTEKNPGRQVEALMALARAGGIDPQHRKPNDPPVDTALGKRMVTALTAIDWNKLDHEQQLTLVRAYEIAFVRFGRPDESTVRLVTDKLTPHFPAQSFDMNWLLCETLVYLQSPTVATQAMALLRAAPTQEEQIEYARSLRMLKTGWTPELHAEYFEWFLKAANYKGGASFEKFIEFIRTDAIASLTPDEKKALEPILAKTPQKASPLAALGAALAGRSVVKEWKLEDLAPAAERGLKKRNFENGRKMFGNAGCSACHRFGNEGGMTAPDLTTASARYSPRDFLDQVINPSKEINEQFVPIVITKNDGEKITGVIVNLNGDTVSVNTDPTSPNQQERVDRKQVKSMEPSKISPMPEGLLNMLTQDEILDLTAYVLSGGDRKQAMFK